MKGAKLTISNIIFYVEHGCYDMLSDYLEGAKAYYAKINNGFRKMDDFEFSVSEILLDSMKEGNETISYSDIIKVKATLGEFQVEEDGIEESQMNLHDTHTKPFLEKKVNIGSVNGHVQQFYYAMKIALTLEFINPF
ncbi:hypothetical protein QQ008_09210 [Fulvivirgaceae bacterium BMA10]|uniref:Uncharacterized protein n=1 Tax=Splendidivirga corallicola TaxID=3051826 RepID=A0ABT8KMU3_9BACT|nr:hypothetical protein [Fulvivirgaceae bacterium BMA10]